MAKEKEMENNSNEKERRKQVQKLTMQVLAVMTLAIILYTVYGMVTKTLNMMLFGFMLGGFVVIYLIMSDIVEPYRLGMFQELTEQRRRGFLKMMLMDGIGAGALLYWISGINSEAGSDILFPFLIYFLTAQMKRKYRAEFEGIVENEEPEETESTESGEQDGK